MAEEIINKLGFDASQTLAELTKLDTQLQGLESRLNGLANTMSSWNSRAGKTVSALKQISANATNAVSQMEKLNKAFSNSGTVKQTTAASAPTTGKAAVPGQIDVGWWSNTTQVAAQAQVAINNVATASQKAGRAAAAAGAQATQAGQQSQNAAQAAAAATDKWVVSWQTLARVTATQFIVRMMSQIRDMTREAVASNVEFSRRIGEIQTIIPEIDKDFRSIANEVTRMSRNFNFPVPDTAEALYQTLSDQFTSVADRTNVLNAATKLAKVGVMDLHSAVELITGTLNAYNLSTTQAEAVAAKFFQTVNLGRIRGEELVPIIGRIAPVASELGVSLNEVLGALISLTISSMKAPEAATALRAGMTALIKPSEQMTKTLREMGYSSGEELIRAKQLQGAFLALREATDGEAASLGKLFLNVRGFNDVARVTGSGAQKVKEGLEVLRQTSGESLQSSYAQYIERDAEQYTREVNKLHTALTTDIGDTLVKLLNQLIRVAGGADNVAAALKGLMVTAGPMVVVLGGVATVLGILSLRLKLAAAGATVFGAVFNNAIAPLALLAGAATYMGSKIVSVLQEARDAYDQSQADRLASEQRTADARLTAEQEANQKILQNLEEMSARVRKAYTDRVDAAKETNEALVGANAQTMQHIVGSQERMVQALRNSLNRASQDVQKSWKKQADIRGRIDDQVFKRQQRSEEDLNRKSNSYRSQALRLSQQAASQMAQAHTPEQLESAEAVFRRAEAYAQEAASIASTASDSQLIRDAEATTEHILRQQLDAERQYQQLRAKDKQLLAAEAAEENARLGRMKELAKVVTENSRAFKKNGDPYTGKELEARKGRVSTSLDQLRKEMAASKKIGASELLDLADLQMKIENAWAAGTSQGEINQLFATPQALSDLNRQITEGVGPVETYLKLTGILTPEETQGKGAQELLAKQSQKAQKMAMDADMGKRKLQEQEQAAKSLQVAVGGLTGSLQSYFETFNNPVANTWNNTLRAAGPIFAGQNMQENARQLKQLLDLFELFKGNPQAATLDAFKQLQAAAQEWQKGWQAPVDRWIVEQGLKDAKTIAEQAETLRRLQQGGGVDKTKLQETEGFLQRIKQQTDEMKAGVRESSKDVQSMGTGAQTTRDSLSSLPDMSNFIAQARSAATAMWDLAYASTSVQPGTAYASKGGVMRYLASGGPAGTDVIPAMLSPGEVVINATSARKFASQLIAMNAGVQPVYRSTGGGVTNIGDINVTVQGSSTGRQTARSIAGELRRELRRRTTIL